MVLEYLAPLHSRLQSSVAPEHLVTRSLFCSLRVLYAASHSRPFSSDGYATRTHGVASALTRSGISVDVASRPGVPWNQRGFEGMRFSSNHLIDGVRYLHARVPSESDCSLVEYLTGCIEVYLEWIRIFKPSVVMAASNWRNALPASIAARESGIPFFYEVRGFWEISRASRDEAWADTEEFSNDVQNETFIAQQADEIFTINRLMRGELVRRGVSKPHIHIVPNGFDLAPVVNTDIQGLRQQLDIRAKHVIGYIGSFSPFEGLYMLIEAVACLRTKGVDVDLLLVGSGKSMGMVGTGPDQCAMTKKLRELANQLDVTEHVFLPGRVQADAVAGYYGLIDLVVVPRLPLPVCELVAPMKPLEAVAYGKRVLLSDVAPLMDLKSVWPGFEYFSKGSLESLTVRIEHLLSLPHTELPDRSLLEGLSWEQNVNPMVSCIKRWSQSCS